MVVRGRGPRLYLESFAGLGNLTEPIDKVALTGTLELIEDSTTITGTGTLFFTECRIGQFISAETVDNSWPLRVRQVISNTEMIVWRAPDSSVSGAIGWRLPRLQTVNQYRGSMLTGAVDPLEKGSILGAGSGIYRQNGNALSASWTLARAPSIALFDPATETFTNFPLGMPTPTGITCAAVAGGTKGMQGGSYSFVVCPARKETGGYNNPSERIDVTIATNDQFRMTLPAMDVAGSGNNAWIIFGTTFAFNFGADLNYLNGPWFYYILVDDTMVAAAGGAFDFEYLDAEIEGNELVSFDNDPPTDAEGVVSLNNQPFWYSCQGQGNIPNPTQTSPGPFIVPAKPNNIEAAPLSLAFSSSPPETILWALSGNGRVFLPTINHLQIAQATPSDIVPILIRPYWKSGFAGPDTLTLIGDMIYGCPLGGPARSAANADETSMERNWAADIWEDIKDASMGHFVTGYDPENEAFWLIYSGSERNDAGFWKSEWWMYGIPQQFWIGRGEFTSDTQDMVVSGIATIGDFLEIIAGGRVI